MDAKKIIPCLDIKDGRVVKGIKFVNLNDIGDPSECAEAYCRQGADEIVFLDITATTENRKTFLTVLEKAAKKVTVPLTIGGGISSIDDIEKVLAAGADKVSINSAAVKNPKILNEAAKKFGKEKLVLALDVKKSNGVYKVVINGGKLEGPLMPLEWAKKAEDLGAGEILLTSMDTDGVTKGYDIEITKLISENVKIPVTASGGAGKLQDFSEVFLKTKAEGALAASLFHYGTLKIPEIKQYLKSLDIKVNI